jgi:transposase
MREGSGMSTVHPVEEWISLYKKGMSFSDIAERYGVTKGTVAGQKWRFENPGKGAEYVKLYRFQRGRADAAKKWQEEIERRQQYKHLLDLFPPETRRRQVLDMFLAGKTTPEIGAELGLSPQGARYHLTAMGVADIPTLQAKTRPARAAAA